MSFNIWNNLDEIGLFLGLTRLDSETNESFFNRIKAFGRWRYKTDYYTQVHSIPIQLGLKTESILKIKSDYKYECTIDWEYFYLSNEVENIRVYINDDQANLSKVLDAIDTSSTFSYTLYDDTKRDMSLRFLVRNKNIKLGKDYINDTRFNLDHGDILTGSIKSVEDGILITEKQSISELEKTGDYFVDYETGYIEIFNPNFTNATIVYKYYDPVFYLEYTELNLRPANLDFKFGFTGENIKVVPHLLNNNVWG